MSFQNVTSTESLRANYAQILFPICVIMYMSFQIAFASKSFHADFTHVWFLLCMCSYVSCQNTFMNKFFLTNCTLVRFHTSVRFKMLQSVPLTANRFKQISHINGLSFVCVRTWVVKTLLRTNFFLQNVQWWGFISVWDLKCRFLSPLTANRFKQRTHGNSFTSECL